MEHVNISFAGCGFLGIYHIGVSSCFKEYAPHLLLNKIAGASIGAISACCLLTEVSLGTFTSEILQIIHEVRARTLGPFNPLVNIQKKLRYLLELHLPKNAYKIVSGRLFVSMTKVVDGSNFIVSEFESNQELIDALSASAFVPFFSGFVPPKFRGYRYLDGGFSNNLPILDENTITVSPFCGESDICPRDTSIQLFHINLCNTSVEVSKPNIDRFGRILFPPGVEVLSQMCKRGFDDALTFLRRNNLISCTQCLTVQRTISLPAESPSPVDDTFDPECLECKRCITKATSSDLPETVFAKFEHAVEAANEELKGWIRSHRGMKILSILSSPYVLTIDVIRAVLMKFVEVAPEFMRIVSLYSERLLEILMNTIHRMNQTGLFLASRVFGPLSVSLYVNEKGSPVPPTNGSRKNRVSVEFHLDSNAMFNKFDDTTFEDSETLFFHPPGTKAPQQETYNRLMNAIDHHEKVMSFHYVDDRNKMNVVEIIDVSNDDQIIDGIEKEEVKLMTNADPSNNEHHVGFADSYHSKKVNVVAVDA